MKWLAPGVATQSSRRKRKCPPLAGTVARIRQCNTGIHFFSSPTLSLCFVKYFFLVDWLDEVVFVNCQLGGFKAVWIWG